MLLLMKTLLRLFNIIQAKKRFKILLIPAGFFVLELCVALVLSWQLFGEHYDFNDSPGRQQASIHNPLIVIQPIHSDRITHPYGTLSDDAPMVHFYSQKYMMKALCFMGSLVFAYMGMFIAVLWMKRYLQHNNLNINWWQWPIACMGAHAGLYLLANSNVVNLIF
jgi:hypothetical protein